MKMTLVVVVVMVISRKLVNVMKLMMLLIW